MMMDIFSPYILYKSMIDFDFVLFGLLLWLLSEGRKLVAKVIASWLFKFNSNHLSSKHRLKLYQCE